MEQQQEKLTVTDFILRQIAELSGNPGQMPPPAADEPLNLDGQVAPSLLKRLESRYGVELADAAGNLPCPLTVQELTNIITSRVKSRMSGQVDAKTVFENFVFNNRCTHLTSPYELNIDTTFRCNLRCIFCYADSEKPDCAADEMTTEQVFDVLENFAANNGAFVLFGGGEPFIREDFLEFVRFAKSKGLWTYIISNGSLITPEVAREYAKYYDPAHDKIQISLDGSCPRVHDKQRGVVGAFDMTVSGIKNLVAQGIRPILNTVVTRVNVDDIPNLIDLAVSLNAFTYRCLKLHKLGRGRKGLLHEKLSISQEQADNLFAYLNKRRDELLGVMGIASDNACVFPMSTKAIRDQFEKRPGLEPKSYACAAGTTKVAVAPNGGVVPCSYFYDFPELYVGSLKERSLQQIWEDSSLWDLYRKPLQVKGKCERCGYLYACKTGCRIMAYVATGDMGAPDSGCTYDPDND
jgi:radical SAM protein with 4Fe4S-binding SPASM domain